jgi:hypothetical protein
MAKARKKAAATTGGVKMKTGRPVDSFPLQFSWTEGDWQRIFDEQIKLLQQDVARARAEERLVVYLSCPISSRGGGYSGTNVDIARHVERALLERWGEAFWVLNPAQYQLESKAGTGLIEMHAQRLGIDVEAVQAASLPTGGDYMRMWTKVLVEDSQDNLGHNFDAFYFLGPRDVHSFFCSHGSQTLTSGIEEYFSRKFTTDASFRDAFAVPGIDWGGASQRSAASPPAPDPKATWIQKRKNFLRFYALRASANFSLGSHDEWEIFRLLNELRRKKSSTRTMKGGDVGEQISGFFDGNQVDPASSEAHLSKGYAV